MEEQGKKKYKLGIALSGGGAKGFAHLGAIQLLQEKGITPNILSGTSAGALAGVLLADGHEPYEVAEMFKDKKFQEFGELSVPNGGFFKTTRFHAFLNKHLRAKKFNELEVDLRVVATDIEHGKMKEFKEGELAPAVMASCCVPIVFSPVKIGDSHYVDGGLFKNFPVTNIRKECECVIGINVSPIRPLEYKSSIKYVAERTFHYMSVANTWTDCKSCDFLIESPDLSKYSMFDLENVDEIFEEGYKIADIYYKDNQEAIKKALEGEWS